MPRKAGRPDERPRRRSDGAGRSRGPRPDRNPEAQREGGGAPRRRVRRDDAGREAEMAADAYASAMQPANVLPKLNDDAIALVEEFKKHYPFPLDAFQEEAITFLAADES